MRQVIKEPPEQEFDLSCLQLFNQLNEDELRRLNNDTTCHLFEKHSVIYEKGSRPSGFFCIKKGIVKVFITGINGKEQIIRFAKKGEIIGYRSLFSNELACSSAKVIDEAILYYIPYQTLLYLIQKNWQFALQMIQILSNELRESNEYIVGLAQKSIRERLAEILLLLKENFDLDNQNTLKIILKREELADFVGTAPESLIRALYELKQAKMIELKGREIRFLDLPNLRRVAHI